MSGSLRLPKLSRRHVLGLSLGALGAPWLRGAQAADGEPESHGMSAFGDLKYPADFSRFDYVNPDAPKGGTFSLIPSVRAYNQSFFTFNSFNAYILKGEGAQGMDLTFATLMARAGDEPDAVYGLAAKSVQISADKTSYRFTLRPEARFHDGSRLTAQDVAFSLTALKQKGHPLVIVQLRDIVKAEALDDAIVVVTFTAKRARDVPLYVAGLPIFSKAYYATRPFEESTLDIPVGSGPYRVGKYEVNRYVEYERVKDWWAADLPVSRGSFNFDIVRYEFYRDRDVAFEGFTGKNYLYREEFTARIWATRYDFPAVRDGRVKRETVPDETPAGGQGWFINTRRDKPEFGHGGERAAAGGRGEAAGAVPQRGAGRGVRRTILAAGVGRIGAGPIAPAQGLAIAAGRRTSGQGRQAAVAERRDLHDRIPDRRAVISAASCDLHEESWLAWHRSQPASDRCRAVPGPGRGFRF